MLLQFVFMLVNISLLYVCVMPNPGGVLNDFRKSRHLNLKTKNWPK